jgi:hypothetical protein
VSGPNYKGAPLEPARGPGLGCFWIQVSIFVALLVLTPIGVINAWPANLTAAMLIVTLLLLFFVGQTAIFLLRIVAADRRSRRRPLRSGTPTVGEIEDRERAQAPDATDTEPENPPRAGH